MYTRPSHRMALVLFALASLAATSFSAVLVWGPTLTPLLVAAALVASAATLAGLASLVVSALLFWAVAALHETVREARWNAGHRLR